MSTLVLLSGGVDSTTLLYHTSATHALTINYGQRHIREQDAAKQIADMAGVILKDVDLRPVGKLMDSALTGTKDVQDGPYDTGRVNTNVPNRNAVFAAVACAWAASEGLDRVVLANHADDLLIYPDCRPAFVSAFDTAMQLSCGVRVESPFNTWRKSEIVKRAQKLGVPLELTWTCYRGGDVHCGTCAACIDRQKAFADADVYDPTTYR